jgi:hypothetical protein
LMALDLFKEIRAINRLLSSRTGEDPIYSASRQGENQNMSRTRVDS